MLLNDSQIERDIIDSSDSAQELNVQGTQPFVKTRPLCAGRSFAPISSVSSTSSYYMTKTSLNPPCSVYATPDSSFVIDTSAQVVQKNEPLWHRAPLQGSSAMETILCREQELDDLLRNVGLAQSQARFIVEVENCSKHDADEEEEEMDEEIVDNCRENCVVGGEAED